MVDGVHEARMQLCRPHKARLFGSPKLALPVGALICTALSAVQHASSAMLQARLIYTTKSVAICQYRQSLATPFLSCHDCLVHCPLLTGFIDIEDSKCCSPGALSAVQYASPSNATVWGIPMASMSCLLLAFQSCHSAVCLVSNATV